MSQPVPGHGVQPATVAMGYTCMMLPRLAEKIHAAVSRIAPAMLIETPRRWRALEMSMIVPVMYDPGEHYIYMDAPSQRRGGIRMSDRVTLVVVLR